MKVLEADIWTTPADAKCIPTNGFVKKTGECVMGRGVAQQARDKFPGIDLVIGSLVLEFGNRVFPLDTSGIYSPGYVLVSFPTKNKWMEPSSLELIRVSCKQLVDLVVRRGWKNVLLPAPGCGNGKLSWREVEPVLDEELWDSPVTVLVKE